MVVAADSCTVIVLRRSWLARAALLDAGTARAVPANARQATGRDVSFIVLYDVWKNTGV